MKYSLLLTLLSVLLCPALATDVERCGGGTVQSDAESGIDFSNDCGELNSAVGTISGDVIVSGTGTLEINAAIGTITGNLTINDNASITLDADITQLNGSITIASGATMTINGDITNMNGSITVDGDLFLNGEVQAAGKLEVKGSGTTTMAGGTFTSTGDGVTIESGATVIMTLGSTIDTSSGVVNSGTITSDGQGNRIIGGVSGGTLPPDFIGCGSNCFDDSALPVELISFSGFQEGEAAILRWHTATELNNDRFEVQKSLDGQSFAFLAEVPGHGTTNTAHEYSFVDFQFRQSCYYRLKQIDFDGTFAYGPIIYTRKTNGSGYLLTHNPVSKTRALRFNLPGDLQASASLMQVNGQVVTHFDNGSIEEIERHFSNELQLLKDGLYIITIKSELGFVSERLLSFRSQWRH